MKLTGATGIRDGRICAVMLMLLCALSALASCFPQDQTGEARTLSTVAGALEEEVAPNGLLAHQQRMFEVLAEVRRDQLPQYLDLDFRFSDATSSAPAAASVGSRYLPAWRERPGLNYYQFLAHDLPSGVAWEGRTLEVVWSIPSAALVVAHRDETDPVFTEWRYRDGEWKAVRMTINAADETLQQARSRRRR